MPLVKMVPPEKGPLAARTRFLLLILVVLCLMINWANILTFNFTIVRFNSQKFLTTFLNLDLHASKRQRKCGAWR